MANVILDVDTDNLFPASPTNHVLHISRFPQTSFVVQECTLPGFMMTMGQQIMPGMTIHHPPDKMTFDPLTVTLLVDEEFRAYRELYRWATGVTGGEDRSVLVQQFINDQSTYLWPDTTPHTAYGRAATTTAGLTILNGAKVPILRVMFYNVHLTQVTGVQFSVTTPDTNMPLTTTATFAYDFYSIVEVGR